MELDDTKIFKMAFVTALIGMIGMIVFTGTIGT